VWTSLSVLAITYVGGVGRIAGAVAAGFLLASNGVMATLLDKLFSFNQYQALIAGLALMLTAVANPDGISKEMQGAYAKLMGRITRGRGGQASAAAAPDPSERGESSKGIERPVAH
jgi:branched-chain amino acid transport system permease protein